MQLLVMQSVECTYIIIPILIVIGLTYGIALLHGTMPMICPTEEMK